MPAGIDSLLPIATLMTWLKPLWLVAVGTGIALVALFAAFFLLRAVVPKIAAVALTTTKEALSQPLFYVILVVGILALIIFPFVPYNTFGDDVKVLKDTGLMVIMILSVILALWTASVSISDEIEGRTALTVLSKPIGRRQFLLGKFFGIIGPVAIIFIVLGALFLSTVSYKVVYDARETANPEPSWVDCKNEMVQIAPGLGLAFLEAMVLASVAVAISTRLPMMPNLVICASVYALGHMVPLLVNTSVGRFPIVRFMANLLAAVLPVLEHFNISTAIAIGRKIPLEYLGWATLYAVLYCSVAMLVALLLFEDRDLA